MIRDALQILKAFGGKTPSARPYVTVMEVRLGTPQVEVEYLGYQDIEATPRAFFVRTRDGTRYKIKLEDIRGFR